MPRIILNQTLYIEAGARKELMTEIQGHAFKKAFVVTDNDLIKFKVADKVFQVLGNFPYDVFSEVKANPTTKNVKDGLKAFEASKADFIIAIGGGSVMDTAKAIGIIHNNPKFADVVSLEGVADTKQAAVFTIALPTTAGTAAEVTINYVITDEVNARKLVCVDPNDIPQVAIVDAELMASMPRGLTAATGMDALTHAIEGYITKGAWTMSDMFELEAVRLISKHLRGAADADKIKAGTNMKDREGMALAQYIAGMGFSNVGLGIVHSMAHPLGARFDTPHGIANAILLPYVMKYNLSSSKEKYVEIAKAMGVDTSKMTLDEGAQAAVKAVMQLSSDVGIPAKLSAVGIKAENLPMLAGDAVVDACFPGNPKAITQEQVLELYKEAL